MKILFIIGTISGGGAEKVVSIISSALAQKHEVTVFLDERTDKEYAISDKVKIECLESQGRGLLYKIRSLKKIKKANDFDAAISFSVQSAFCNVLSRHHEKVFLSIRATTSVTTPKAHWKILKMCCNLSKAIITVSDFAAQDLVECVGVDRGKITTIYNPFDSQLFENVDDTSLSAEQKDYLKGVENSILISTHGRLSQEKAHCHLIRAMKSVVARHPEARLCIMGVGPLESELAALIQNMELQDKVFLFGHTMNPFIVLKESDIYAFSSSCEGFPNAVLDAMACALPVVSSDCHGVHELLSPDSECDAQTESIDYAYAGLLSKCFDDKWLDAEPPLTYEEECFANAICKLIEDTELREQYSARANERIQDFDIEKIVKQWEQVIS